MAYRSAAAWRPMHYLRDTGYAVRVANARGRGTTLGLGGGMPERYRQSYGRVGGSQYYGFPLTYGQHIDYVSTPVMLGNYEGIFTTSSFGPRPRRPLGDSGDGLGGVLAVL